MSAATSRIEHPNTNPSAGAVVTKAVWRAAIALGLSQKELGRLLGVSEATVSRIASGKVTLDVDKKEGELALLFVRLFRSLDALVGGSEKKARAWFSSANSHISGVPKERVQTVEGLVHVTQYLDAMRGKI
jgi:transcriptional regulator with XRE-family HTH domain